jgi:ferritin-like metal-binding protein YciE
VAELDGVWKVERISGALPPMLGIVKRIHGTRGSTRVGDVAGVPFDVRGRELHYRSPFGLFVDVLEPDGDGEYKGRATLGGVTFARFRLRRIPVADQLTEQLIKHIDEAHAMEQNVLRMLDGMIQTTDDPEIVDVLEHHKMETQRHSDLMQQRLEAHDASPSMVKQAGGILQALAKMPLDMVRGEKAGRNARDGFATEHLEIASYELLKRVAQRAGDDATVAACDQIIADERSMAEKIASNWDRFAELSLQEEGVTV